MAIEAQRFPNQGDSLFPQEEDELIVELPEEDPTAGGVEFQVGQNGEMLPMTEPTDPQNNNSFSFYIKYLMKVR